MKSLRVRLTLLFALGFVAAVGVFVSLTYYDLDLRLRRDTFAREDTINPNWILHGSYSEAEIQGIMAELIQSSLLYSLPVMLLVILLGYVIARQSLRPIESLNRQLQAVGPRTLGTKVELPEADDQFRSLERHLNDMLARLERSFGEMSEYAAKVSHELRTPLTILRHKIEQSQGRIEAQLAEDVQEELHRLTHVVEQSLLIAKAEQGRLQWTLERFDLATALEEVVKDFHLLADAEGRPLELKLERACVVETDARYCKQILHALLTNALIHGKGAIQIRLLRRGGRVRFAMMNRLRASPTASELTLGLGLRVVRALVGRQPDLRFHQHHGSRLHATRLTFPAVSGNGALAGGKPGRLVGAEAGK